MDLSYQYRYHLMIHGLRGLYFEEDARLQFNSGYRRETFGVLIQSDKAEYKPGQTGKTGVQGTGCSKYRSPNDMAKMSTY